MMRTETPRPVPVPVGRLALISMATSVCYGDPVPGVVLTVKFYGKQRRLSGALSYLP
jgi:hypothetical protein